MSIYASFQTDPQAEQDGVILDFGDFSVRIARAGGANKKFEKTLRRKLDKHKRAIQFDALPEEVALRLLAESYSEAIVLSWEGVKGADEEEIPFSPAACAKLFIELPEFFLMIRQEAEKIANFLAAKRKESAGN